MTPAMRAQVDACKRLLAEGGEPAGSSGRGLSAGRDRRSDK